MEITKKVLSIKEENGYFSIITDGPEIRLFFMTDDIVRIRASFDKKFLEESYTLAMTAWEDRLDSVLGDLRKRISPVRPSINESLEFCEFKTASLTIKINKLNYHIGIFNSDGVRIYSDIPGRAFKKDRQGRVYHYSAIDQQNDCFYGFGEAPGPINKSHRVVRQAPRDSLGYDAELTTPLYKHIPFYIKINRENKHAVGMFYNNSYESLFDMGCERSGYWPRYSYFCADGGDIDLFFINGPDFSKVVERYTDLTGKTALCPMEGMGYLGSTMYYVELPKNCDDEIISFIDKNIQERIPIDNFHLSSGYTVDEKNGKRNVFTWNKTRFSNPPSFFQRMEERGVSVSPNVKPGVLLLNPNYKDFDQKNAFVMNPDKKGSYVDQWWGGPGSFVDFTNPEGRKIWKNFLKTQLIEMGTTSIWNDNCEYDSLDDREASCDFDGKGGIIDELKPIQSLIMAHVAREAIHESKPGIRPYIVNRSGYAGIQKYASTWAGDNFTSWKTLKNNIATVLGMGLSGVANNGCDIGGFWGSSPDAELFVRWVQNGIFQPRFSIHSCNTNNTVTEPWMFSEHKKFIIDAIKFRYSLMPYLYSLLYEAHTKGTPILRPLFYEFQKDLNCYNESESFMLGSYLLVANVLEPGQTVRKVYLPEGSDWYYWTDRKKFKGGQTVEVPLDISTIPMFIRDNAIIPTVNNFTSINKQKIDNLNIIIPSDKDSEFTLFEDDGKTYGYMNGDFLKTKLSVQGGEKVSVSFNKEGNFQTNVKNILLEVFRREKGPYWVTINDKTLKQYLHRDKWETAEEGWYYSQTRGSALIKYKNLPASYNVVVSFEKFDLIGM
ncbi:MAG: TIM-barrel domain-containing protein [Lentisphaerota bacterium]